MTHIMGIHARDNLRYPTWRFQHVGRYPTWRGFSMRASFRLGL